MERVRLERLTDAALGSLMRDAVPPPHVLRFLLRRYLVTAREDVRDGLEAALAAAIAAATPTEQLEDLADWTEVWIDAAAATADTRVGDAAAAMIARQRREWGSTAETAAVMRSIGACVCGRALASDDEEGVLADAIDELERIIGRGYRPGGGMAAGALDDQIASGLALVAAFQATGRLPYAMLAEELLQFARRSRWNTDRGLFNTTSNEHAFTVNCDGIRLLRAVGRWHEDPEYLRVAVVAPDAAYATDAGGALAALDPSCDDQELSVAMRYGILLSDWLADEEAGPRGAPATIPSAGPERGSS